MLTKKHSPAYAQLWRYSLALPLFIGLWIGARTGEVYAQTAGQPNPAIELFEVEKAPEFPGGQDALIEYLSKNIQYPEAAKRAGVEGIVALRFVIDTEGKVTQVESLMTKVTTDDSQSEQRSELEAEATRVVKAMPQWSPAYKDGAPVACKFTLPIRFKLK